MTYIRPRNGWRAALERNLDAKRFSHWSGDVC